MAEETRDTLKRYLLSIIKDINNRKITMCDIAADLNEAACIAEDLCNEEEVSEQTED